MATWSPGSAVMYVDSPGLEFVGFIWAWARTLKAATGNHQRRINSERREVSTASGSPCYREAEGIIDGSLDVSKGKEVLGSMRSAIPFSAKLLDRPTPAPVNLGELEWMP